MKETKQSCKSKESIGLRQIINPRRNMATSRENTRHEKGRDRRTKVVFLKYRQGREPHLLHKLGVMTKMQRIRSRKFSHLMRAHRDIRGQAITASTVLDQGNKPRRKGLNG